MRVQLPYDLLNEQMHKRKGVYYLPFVPDHFDHIDFDAKEISTLSKAYDVKSMLANQAELGTAFTAFKYNRPVAIVGIVFIWQGVGEMWSIFDNQAREYPTTMMRVGLDFSDIAMRYLHLHRLQITVRTDDNRAIRFAEAIGFKTECVMQKFGPDGVDYLLMARF